MTALSIGPAGENKVPWACVSNDQYHKAGRGGTGALMGSKNVKAIAVAGTGTVDGRRRARVPRGHRAHQHRLHPHRHQLLGPRRRHAGPGRRHRRRRLPAHAQLLRGHVRGCGQHQLRVVPEDPRQEARLLPVHAGLPQLPSHQRRRGRGPRVRDHRAVRLQRRGRRHRRPHEVQPALRRVRSRHDLHRQRARPGDGHDREGHPRLRRALRRPRGVRQGPRAAGHAHRHRRRAGAGHPCPGREVRPSRAGACRSRVSRRRATTRVARSA